RYEDITEKFGYGKMELLYELLEELVEKVDEADE
ncbi:MAG: homoprotocatechuate degradation operon regulator HpaR, partial [Porticoccaceae bacterium]|nr:homoprotocatechuate degradation operon regulator HpaR [Porticoccaceae bacterium]